MSLRLTFYEVHGKKCYDLLRNRAIVHLRSDQNETMHIRGARRVEIIGLHDPEQLMHVLKDALALRSSEVTERNPISSRSHAVCTIELLQVDCVAASDGGATMTRNGTGIDGSRNRSSGSSSSSDSVSNGNDENQNSNNTCELVDDDNCSTGMDNANNKEKIKAISLRNYLVQHNSSLIDDRNDHVNGDRDDVKTTSVGKITLVDLAGSERNYETIQMTAAQHRESAEINFALMALKDCFRAYHMQLVTAKSKGSKHAIIDSNSRASGVHDSSKTSGLFTSTSLLSQCIKPSSITTSIQNDNDLSNTAKTTNDHHHNHFPLYQQFNVSTSDAKTYYTEVTTGITSVSSSSSLPSSSSSLSLSSAAVVATARIPFRSSLLTRVLKSCFTSSGTSHRTTIIATISPTPTDLQHTINTIAHTVLMCPELHRLTHRVTVEVPLFSHRSSYRSSGSSSSSSGEYHQYKPIQDWTSKDVLIWIGSVERGRFAHVVLPKDIDGRGLLQLSVSRLNDLFASSASNKARNQKEGKLMMMMIMIHDDDDDDDT